MLSQGSISLGAVFPACRSILPPDIWERLIDACGENPVPEVFSDLVTQRSDDLKLPAYVPELARLERMRHAVDGSKIPLAKRTTKISVNPSLRVFQASWSRLADLLNCAHPQSTSEPEPAQELILLWKEAGSGRCWVRAATDEDLLVLKTVVEEIPPEVVAETGDLPLRAVDAAIDRAVTRGILLAPDSKIRRDPACLPKESRNAERYVAARIFTLQWHITQTCDLHCKHCYDRSNRTSMDIHQAIDVLDDLKSFCHGHNVACQVSFTGGNPLLYPEFTKLYREASRRGFSLAMLGNPASRGRIEELLNIQKPGFFQVSLEGLPQHNDEIRGAGHFQRTMDFLKILRDLDVYSMVMLTLTRDNLRQVIPLGELLRGKTDAFYFNRLALVGEGARLHLPARDDYVSFLKDYTRAVAGNPVLGLKDNLINIIRDRAGQEPFGGCAGFGCGAAFNFLALLPDGEVHACRKFPSPVGNVLEQSLQEIYHSEEAQHYRRGSAACAACRLRPVCGGCLAISHSFGLDIFRDRDPFCFIDDQP
jgi:selenobiotic family peptide radical SAM maturase